jgi:hypothetical protein
MHRTTVTGYRNPEPPVGLMNPSDPWWPKKPVQARQLQGISWVFSPMPFAGPWRVTEWPLDRPLPCSGDERKRVLGVPRCPEGSNTGKPRETLLPQFGLSFYCDIRNTQFGSNNA